MLTNAEKNDLLLLAALLFYRNQPMAPHHIEAVKARLGDPTDEELLEVIRSCSLSSIEKKILKL